MYDWIRDDDRLEAVYVLQQRLTLKQMREAIDRDIERLVSQVEHRQGLYSSRIPDAELARFMVDLGSVDLLADRQLRLVLTRAASEEEIDQLYSYVSSAPPRSKRERIEAIVERRWDPGKGWARYFSRVLGFPSIFAGIPGSPEGPAIEEVEPHIPLPPLHDYQQELFKATIELLQAPAGQNRSILSLPTGAGKTRTAVEALLFWWDTSSSARPFILWIAQSDELCEQAFEAFREVWIDRGGKGHHPTLRLYRCWGSRRALPEIFSSSVIIASIQKLYELVDPNSSGELAMLSDDLAAVVVDEAHHALAPSYTAVLQTLKVLDAHGKPCPTPLLGLTATPYRGQSNDETLRLAKRFHSRLLTPELLGDDPLEALRAQGILARVDHRVVQSGQSYELTDHDLEHIQAFNRFPDTFVQQIGKDPHRNQMLLEHLLNFPSDYPVLFFGCSVEHASAMAVLLRRNGRSAAVVTGTTRRATRRYLIEEFRAGRVQVLCNFGVLTTGFDAPKIQAIIIARPTLSVVLYEQMIGRGMRGPRNGGTDYCVIIDMVDNIRRFQGQMAYTRMQDYWR